LQAGGAVEAKLAGAEGAWACIAMEAKSEQVSIKLIARKGILLYSGGFNTCRSLSLTGDFEEYDMQMQKE
jgi:hypothetical protein